MATHKHKNARDDSSSSLKYPNHFLAATGCDVCDCVVVANFERTNAMLVGKQPKKGGIYANTSDQRLVPGGVVHKSANALAMVYFLGTCIRQIRVRVRARRPNTIMRGRPADRSELLAARL